MTHQEYEGWWNYETWAVAYAIDNDQPLYERRCTAAQEAVEHEVERAQFAREIEVWVTYDMIPEMGATLGATLLGAALSEVNWDEIAENWLDEAREALAVKEGE